MEVCDHGLNAILADVPAWMLPDDVEIREWAGDRQGWDAELAGASHPHREALFHKPCGGFICEWHRMGIDARQEPFDPMPKGNKDV